MNDDKNDAVFINSEVNEGVYAIKRAFGETIETGMLYSVQDGEQIIGEIIFLKKIDEDSGFNMVPIELKEINSKQNLLI